MSNPIFNPRPKDFNWASDRAANLREPITALKEKGWQYADAPTASNFNWLISELSKWDKYLEGRIDGTGDDLSALFKQVNQQNKELRRDLRLVMATLNALIQKVISHHPQPPFIHRPLPDFED
jgi:hypothetical protein